jgi:hypothetical protein
VSVGRSSDTILRDVPTPDRTLNARPGHGNQDRSTSLCQPLLKACRSSTCFLSEPAEGDIAIGGATLAAEAAALGLIDEYRDRVYPVLVGGGIPFFPQRERRVDLELVETRTFSSRVVYLRYRVAR